MSTRKPASGSPNLLHNSLDLLISFWRLILRIFIKPLWRPLAKLFHKKTSNTQTPRKKNRQQLRWGKFFFNFFLTLILTLQFTGLSLWFNRPAFALANLVIEPITWDFVGLDSNKPESQGPNTYVVGARVCNTSPTEDAINVKTRFYKDGVDNGYTFIRLQGGDTYTFPLIPKNDGSAGTTGAIAGGYIFDTPANGSLKKTKYNISYTPKNCQDFYYNFETTRSTAAWQTYQKYYIDAWADNAGHVQTPRPRQIYIEQLISQSRNYVYNFTCTTESNPSPTSGSVNVLVGETFVCDAYAHTATAYPELSFTSDIPNVIFQVLDVNTTYSNPGSGVNSTVYADACGWVQDPTDSRYHKSPSQCEGETQYTDQYPYGSTNGGVGETIHTRYRIKVISFPSGVPNPIKVSNVILDNSGGSYHYNADYGSGFNVIYINVQNPPATDLSVTKTHTGNFSYGPNPYNLTVTATTNPAKAPVTLTDTLPTGYLWDSDGNSTNGTQLSITGTDANKWTCGVSGQVLTCTYDSNKDYIADDFTVGSNALTFNIYVDKNTASTNSTNFVKVASNPVQTDNNLNNNTASDPTLILAKPNLVLTKSGSPATFPIGTSQGTYTLTVSNASALNASGPLTLVDTLPTGVTFNSASGTNNGTAWSCSATDITKQKVICSNTRGLNSDGTTNESTTITMTVDVSTAVQDGDSGTAGLQVTNTATVTGASLETNMADNTATVTNLVNKPSPDLVVSKTDNSIDFIANTNTNKYYITVTNKALDANNNPTSATSGTITVVDTLPSPLTYVSATNATGATGWTCSYTAPKITCTNTNKLAPGQSSSIEVTVGVPNGTSAQSVTNNVSVDVKVNGVTEELDTTNNTNSDNTNIITAQKGNTADIAVVKTVTTSPTGPNTPITYKLAITNPDNTDIANTGVFLDVVPAQITSVTATCATTGLPNPGTCCATNMSVTTDPSTGGTRVTCPSGTFISLPKQTASKDGEVDITITGTATKSGPIYNSTSVTIDPSANIGEKDLTNNYSGILTTVPGPALTLGKAPVAGSVFQTGEIITYRLTVTNPGSPNTLNSTGLLTITDTLPANYSYISGSSASGSSGWECDLSGSTVTCLNSSTTLTPGQTTAVDLLLRVLSGGTNILNTATLTKPDGTTTTGTDTRTITSVTPDLSLTKTASSLNVGQQGTFTLKVQNVGTGKAIAPIIVRDTLDSSLTFLSGTGTGWTCATQTTPTVDPQTVICTNPSDLAGGNAYAPDLTLNVLVSNTAPSSINNTAKVNLAPDATITGETVFTNNTATISNVSIAQSSDIGITKTTSGTFVAGQTGTFQIKVTNNGPSPYTGIVQFNDTLDNKFTFASLDSKDPVTGLSHGFTCSGTPLVCSKPTTGLPSGVNAGLLAGESVTLNLNVNIDSSASGSISNTATLTTNTLTPAKDPTGDTNDSSTVSVTIQPNNSTLCLSKDDGDGDKSNGTTNQANFCDSSQNQTTAASPDEPSSGSLQTKFVQGGQGKYTLIVYNDGPASAKAPVQITEPANTTLSDIGLTYAGYSLTRNWKCDPAGTGNSTTGYQNFVCTYGNWDTNFTTFTQADLPAQSFSGVEIKVNVNSSSLATFNGSVYSNLSKNTAKVTSANNSTGATATEYTAIINPADLQVSKTGVNTLSISSPVVNTGTYTVRIRNLGPGVSQPDIYLQDYLPTGLVYDSAASVTLPSGWSLLSYNSASNQLTYKGTTALTADPTVNPSPNPAAGSYVDIPVPVKVGSNPPASVTNLVRVQGFTPEPVDPSGAFCDASFTTQPTNNCATKVTTITGGASTNLSITKVPSASSVNWNTPFTYTLTMQNTATPAQDVSVSDVLPSSLQFVSISAPSPVSSTTPFGTVTRSCSQATVTQNGQIITTNSVSCNLFTVAANETITATLTAKALVSGTIPNTATIGSTTFDTDYSNNTNTGSVTITNVPSSGVNTISGTVYNDVNDNGTKDSGETTGASNVKVLLYQDDGSVIGAIDANDTLISTTLTDSSGNYSFTLGIKGNFVLKVDPTTLPSSSTLTPSASPSNLQSAVFTAVPDAVPNDINNNFGYKFLAPTQDFGDAPNTYSTTNASNGPRHTVNANLYLGTTAPDTEADASTPLDGTGDDVTGIPDDEDGVSLGSLATTMTSYSVLVGVKNTTGSNATLVGWVDFDRDGIFQSDEGTTATIANNATTATLTWSNIGSTGPNIVAGSTYARFRITSDAITTSSVGGSASNGEVEDYPLNIRTTADLSVTKTVDKVAPNVGSTIIYTVTITNSGPSNATGVQVKDLLPAGITYVSDNGGGNYDKNTGIWNIGNLSATVGSNTATLQITGTVNTSGSIVNTAQVYASDQYDPDSTPNNNIGSEDDQKSVSINSIAAGSQFLCDLELYLMQDPSVGNARLYSINRTNTPYALTSIGSSSNIEYNALGFNPKDGYMYAIKNDTTGTLYRIDKNGAIYSLGTLTGWNSNWGKNWYSGTFLEDGTYIINNAASDVSGSLGSGSSDGLSRMVKIDLVNMTVISSTTIAQQRLFDIAVNPLDGQIYGYDETTGGGVLLKFNPSTLAVTQVSTASQSGVTGRIASAFFDAFGRLFLYGSPSGDTNNFTNFYTANTSTGVLSFVTTSASVVRSDGATCGFGVAMNKTVSPTSTPTGTIVTYTYTITNQSDLPVTTNFNDSMDTASNPGTVTATERSYVAGTLTNPFGGTANSYGGSDVLTITGLTIPANTTNVITVNVAVPNNPVLAGTTVYNQACLNGADSSSIVDYPASICSDDGDVIKFTNATPLNISSAPGMQLVKRITAINNTRITGFINDPSSTNDDDPKWPDSNAGNPAINTYLDGQTACKTGSACNGIQGVKPGDDVEYTIYFLSNGSEDLKNVNICDRIPANTTFQPDTYTSGKGILLGWSSSQLTDPTTNTGTDKTQLTNATDTDKGTYYSAGTALPSAPCGGSTTNSNGGVVVNVTSTGETIPKATTSGTPVNSYGFVRFNVKVNQ